MGFKVIQHFEDLQDNRHSYQAGDVFPRLGFAVTEERIAELAGNKNRLGKALIEEVPPEDQAPAPKRKKATTDKK